jgi:hypothetical protein
VEAFELMLIAGSYCFVLSILGLSLGASERTRRFLLIPTYQGAKLAGLVNGRVKYGGSTAIARTSFLER